jgi:hypothetical protein
MPTMQSVSLLTDEMADFLASCPGRKEILRYRPSGDVQDRFRDLLQKSKDGSITKFEQWELDQFEYVESLMRLVKARLRSEKSNHE